MISRHEYEKLKSLVRERGSKGEAFLLPFDRLLSKGGKQLGKGYSREAWSLNVEGRIFCFKYHHFKYRERNGMSRQNEKEVEVFRRIWQHPLIPEIYDWDREDFCWLEMELLNRVSWDDLPPDEEIEALHQVWGMGDLFDASNWGRNSKGQLKICDLGMFLMKA